MWTKPLAALHPNLGYNFFHLPEHSIPGVFAMHARLRFTILALAVACSLGLAQEKKDAPKQKANAVATLQKADLPKATVIETEHFLIGSSLPDEKAKALGAMLEKVAPVARKGAQFEDKEEAWKGKLAVYYLPENRDFKGFIRNVVNEKPEGIYYNLRADDPYLVDPVEVSGKATESDQFADTTAIVAGAYLKSKGGSAAVPEWLVDGFGRITAMRAEGMTAKRYTTYKTAAKTAAAGTKTGKPAAIADLWAESRPANVDVIAASFAEYLAYGPGKDNFLKLVSGFRPDENGNVPMAPQAFEAAGWKDLSMLEKAWQKWVTTGK